MAPLPHLSPHPTPPHPTTLPQAHTVINPAAQQQRQAARHKKGGWGHSFSSVPEEGGAGAAATAGPAAAGGRTRRLKQQQGQGQQQQQQAPQPARLGRVRTANGAEAGTISSFTSACLQTRVPKDADIVFIEFAVNDPTLGGDMHVRAEAPGPAAAL
jgi:hypothetical protein